MLSPTRSLVVSVKKSPALSSAFPPSKSRVRISGPFVSSKIAIGSPSSARSFLTMSIRFFCSSCVPCEKFSLATFIPASISFRSTSSLSVAGPSVQTIFVFLITYYLVLYLFAKSSPILTYTPSIIAYVKIYNHISKVFLS